MNESVKNLLSRRSVRAYTDQAVPEELLAQVLEAGLYAPSGLNLQSVTLVAITDRATRDQLARMNGAAMPKGGSRDPFYGAPVVIVVLADRARSPLYREDGALAMGNLLNAAHALGLGSCWIHRAAEEFESAEGKALLEKWGLSGDFVGIGHCILGYAAETPAAKERRPGRIVRV